jgi:hypothetical protein
VLGAKAQRRSHPRLPVFGCIITPMAGWMLRKRCRRIS